MKILGFLGVGAVGFLIDAAIYFSLQELFAPGVLFCKIPATIGALSATWVLNRNITFRDGRRNALLLEFVIYLVASSFGAAANVTVLMICSNFDGDYRHIPAYLAGTLAGLVINFLLYDKIVFRIAANASVRS